MQLPGSGSVLQITNVEEVPEVAFTGDTTAEFITDPANADVLRAKLLIMEASVRRIGVLCRAILVF